jgi:glycosyltransferase involved in cell wall biosynthesis
MTDLLILYDVPGWAYHFRARALQACAPPDFRVRLGAFNRCEGTAREHAAWIGEVLGERPPDLCFVLCHCEAHYVRLALSERGWSTRLVVSWNNGWPRLEHAYRALLAAADHVIVNNRAYWLNSGMLPRSTAIANGVDGRVFKPTRPIESRPARVLWAGSELHREIKGYDELLVPLAQRLRADGIDCDLHLVDSRGDGKRSPEQMADWYNSGSVLVCASASEGTPNTALEAAACGCALVSTRVGNMPELLRHGENGYLVERDIESLYRGVRLTVEQAPRLALQLQNDIQSWRWEERSRAFFELFRAVASAPPAHPSSEPRDLRDQVTVFVSTVGAASFDDCMAALQGQTCRFRLRVIERVAPMSAAFQRMLDECETPFYVQVDEDMILDPDAIHTLYRRMCHAEPDVAMVVGWLWDGHLERHILGVKLFRHAIVARYPYRDLMSCEKDQLQRLRADGYRHLLPPIDDPARDNPWSMGSHGTHYDGISAFERYATLEARRQEHPVALDWFDRQAHQFLRRFREQPNEVDLMALMGVLAGRIAASPAAGEKDFTRYHGLPGLAEARAFLEACKACGPCAARPIPQATGSDEPS